MNFNFKPFAEQILDMAECEPRNLSSVVSDLLECSICLATYNDPRNLNCLHKFCYNCIAPLATRSQIACPLCRTKTKLSKGGVGALKRDSTISSLLEITQANEKSHTNHKECGACEEMEQMEKFCKTCRVSLCRKCSRAHVKFKVCGAAALVSVKAMEVQTRSKKLVDETVGVMESLLTRFKSYTTKNIDFGEKVKQDIQCYVDDILSDIEVKRIRLFDEVDRYYAGRADIKKITAELHSKQSTLVSLIENMKKINIEATVGVEAKVKLAGVEVGVGAEFIKSFTAFEKELSVAVAFDKTQMKKDCELGIIKGHTQRQVQEQEPCSSRSYQNNTGMTDVATGDEQVSPGNSRGGRGNRGRRGGGRGARMEINKVDLGLPPSPCVFVRRLSEQADEQDLVNCLTDFGCVTDVKLIPWKRQALVEFENIEQAIDCVEYNQRSPIYCAGHPAFFNYATSTHIMRPGPDRDSDQGRMDWAEMLENF